MMLPGLQRVGAKTITIERFLGYRHVAEPSAGAFWQTENISTAEYPLLAPRRPRKKVAQLTSPVAFSAKGALAWVDGNNLYYSGNAVAELAPGEARRKLVSMGAWLIVWPDGVRYNTATGLCDTLANRTQPQGTVTACLCAEDGTPSDEVAVGETAPQDTTRDWVCTADTPHTLRRWNAASKLWITLPTSYAKLAGQEIGVGFAAGDTVAISGVAGAAGEVLNGDHILVSVEKDSLVVAALLEESTAQESGITINRALPHLDFLTECGNRLWGCSSEENAIYASKLGDPTNWQSFAGLDTDSYAATVGTDGPFTGAVTWLGYVLFFKEHCLHKVYGTKPSNFQITVTECEGVQPGCDKSLCVADGALYYKSDVGVMEMSGGLPARVDEALGNVPYRAAVGGVANGCYRISMQDMTGTWHLFCRENATGLWCREDATQALEFAALGAKGYLLAADGGVWQLDAEPTAPQMTAFPSAENTETDETKTPADETDGPVQWSAQTAILEPTRLTAGYLRRLRFRLWLPAGSHFTVQLSFDSGPWQTAAEISAKTEQSRLLPVLVRRCDHVRLRLSGLGPCRVYACSFTVHGGAEVKQYAQSE